MWHVSWEAMYWPDAGRIRSSQIGHVWSIESDSGTSLYLTWCRIVVSPVDSSSASSRSSDYVFNVLLPLESNKWNLKWGHVARYERPDVGSGASGHPGRHIRSVRRELLHGCWYDLNVHKIIRLSVSAQIVYRCSTSPRSIPEYRYLYFTIGRNMWETKPKFKPLRSKQRRRV
jgi:hypothetical protein